MPQTKTKPSDIAIEAKRHYIPHIARTMPNCPARSLLHADTTLIPVPSEIRTKGGRPRITVEDYDPLDLIIHWKESGREMPIVNMANERRAGGDWESALIAPEECFARRSNLVHALPTPWNYETSTAHYPIPQTGGLYSPSIVVFRGGPDKYQAYHPYEYQSLAVISVAPVRRPKLDSSGTRYSFEAEKELVREKMKAILRIAAHWGHRDICLGAFGIGPVFRNPARETANMWRQLLFEDREFEGAFVNVVFAIHTSADSASKTTTQDLETFREVFDPRSLFPTTYR